MTRPAYDCLNVVVPVYNEGENIGTLLEELRAKVRTPLRILIVYDFDEDTTCPVVREFMTRQSNITLLKNHYGRGVLNALKTGFAHAEGVVLVLMADLSDDLAQIDAMLARINEGYDLVCGSRYAEGGKQDGGPRLKGFLSRMAGLSLHYLAGLPTHDVSNSFKMYTKEVLDRIDVESNGGFEIGMEILVKAHFLGYRVTEVPSVWHDRTAGRSRFKLARWLPKYLRWYLFALKCRAKSLVGSGLPEVADRRLPAPLPQTTLVPTHAVDPHAAQITVRPVGVRELHRPSERHVEQDPKAAATPSGRQ